MLKDYPSSTSLTSMPFDFQTIASILLLQRLQLLFPYACKTPFLSSFSQNHTSPPPTHRHKHTEDIFCIADWNGSLPVVNASERIYFLMFYTNKTPRSLLMSCCTLTAYLVQFFLCLQPTSCETN